jgi:hypothetical protein
MAAESRNYSTAQKRNHGFSRMKHGFARTLELSSVEVLTKQLWNLIAYGKQRGNEVSVPFPENPW